MSSQPNIVFVFADQMRAQATGYAGNPNARTPNLDALSREGVTFTTAVSNCPVCTPYRASLLTGRYPLSTGLFMNDIRLGESEMSIADVLGDAGYDTAYIGKWHLDGPERSAFTPPGPRRQGFDFWAVRNCTHRYLESLYYQGSDPDPRRWQGYDAHAQTDTAIEYIRTHARTGPYCLFLSWGPPHNPYDQVPERYLAMYEPGDLTLRPNVSHPEGKDAARKALAGYYAHVTALDEDVGRLLTALDETNQAENTLFVFTSDHGDMLGSQGYRRKQWAWDESILVPLLVRYPRAGQGGRVVNAPVGAVDLMPTMLSLADIGIPETVEGTDLSHLVTGTRGIVPTSALIESIAPFSEAWPGPEWRGVRTERHTYVETLEGPWLLYDNQTDPYQLHNLADDEAFAALRRDLVGELRHWLDVTHDDFAPADVFRKRWGYAKGKNGEVPYVM